jgi:hypothetical protein
VGQFSVWPSLVHNPPQRAEAQVNESATLQTVNAGAAGAERGSRQIMQKH